MRDRDVHLSPHHLCVIPSLLVDHTQPPTARAHDLERGIVGGWMRCNLATPSVRDRFSPTRTYTIPLYFVIHRNGRGRGRQLELFTVRREEAREERRRHMSVGIAHGNLIDSAARAQFVPH